VSPEAFLSGRNFMKLETHQLPIVGLVPCSCDVLRCRGEYLFAFERPEHPITKTLQEIAANIEKFQSANEQDLVVPSPTK